MTVERPTNLTAADLTDAELTALDLGFKRMLVSEEVAALAAHRARRDPTNDGARRAAGFPEPAQVQHAHKQP